MKRVVWSLTVALLILVVTTSAAGCGARDSTTSSDAVAGSSSTNTSQTSESSPPSTTATAQSADAPVLAPHDLLSAGEASEISGFAVTLDEGTLSEDPASGTISERYAYDLDGTGIHALVEIHQDSFKPSEAVAAGKTALSEFSFQKGLLKDEITSLGLGEQPFTLNSTGQLHMYYQGYYVVVAFDADQYSSKKNARLNVLLGTRILANLQAALQ
jgi:hypothetical protein